MSFFSGKLTLEKLVLFVLMIINFSSMVVVVTGEVYKVGDSAGWTVGSNSSYADWVSSKIFRVHDILLFEYDATNDNVILVRRSEFKACNTSAPLKMYNSGNDSFTIKASGHYYFTSNFSGHCEGGQKLDVRVLKHPPPVSTPPPSHATSPSPSPNVSHTAPTPTESKALAPSPAENKATTRDSKWLLMSTVGVTISGFVVLVHGHA